MRVALDVTARISGVTGVARYAAELDAALVRRGIDVRRYAMGRAPHPAPAGTRRIRVPLRVLHAAWSRSELPRIEWLCPSADLVHTLDLIAPPTRLPSVATVHDLDAVVHPDLHPPREVSVQRVQLESLRRADVILADSGATARALAGAGVGEERVMVVPLGRTALPDAAAATVAGADRYVLCVGRIERRKGQDVLVRAMADSRLASTALVLVGPDGLGADEVRAEVVRLGLAGRVRFEGPVEDDRLAGLYAGASVFSLASRGEGFGLPVLEAMAVGLPVVATKIDALTELTADAALLVPVDDAAALADALVAALDDGAVRDRLGSAGQARASSFTWDACAMATVAAYQRLLG